jgi:two-component system NtrC family sensor kinase
MDDQFAGEYHRKLLALQTILNSLQSGQSYEEMPLVMLRNACKILNAEEGMLAILEAPDGRTIVKKILGEGSSWLYQVNLEVEGGLLAECLRTRRPFVVTDTGADPRFNPMVDGAGSRPIRSLMLAPLMVGEHLLGVICLLNNCQDAFNDSDLELFVTVSGLVAYFINSSSFVEQLQVANATLEIQRWQLLKSRNTLRALFDNIPLSFYIVDCDYKLIAVNLSRSKRTVEKPSELVGSLCYQALFGKDEVCPGCRVSETLFGGQNTTRIERNWDAGNEPEEWEILTYPIFDEKGQVEQAILLEQDMTEKRRLENRLIQSEKLAVVGQLAAGLAHEINNPLTAVIANAQLLQREPGFSQDVKEALEIIEAAGVRAAQVVRNLLDLARKDQYRFEPADVNQSIEKAVALLQHEFISRSILLSFEKGEDLPEIMISPEHMQGVWVNLLLNAIYVTSDGGSGRIQITTCKRVNEVLVTIADNGEGIPPERANRIFEPFYTTKGPGQGTGLGLTICQRIIKQHGGHIYLDSQPGVGTKFTVALPIS